MTKTIQNPQAMTLKQKLAIGAIVATGLSLATGLYIYSERKSIKPTEEPARYAPSRLPGMTYDMGGRR